MINLDIDIDFEKMLWNLWYWYWFWQDGLIFLISKIDLEIFTIHIDFWYWFWLSVCPSSEQNKNAQRAPFQKAPNFNVNQCTRRTTSPMCPSPVTPYSTVLTMDCCTSCSWSGSFFTRKTGPLTLKMQIFLSPAKRLLLIALKSLGTWMNQSTTWHPTGHL